MPAFKGTLCGHAWTASVLVDEFDAGSFQACIITTSIRH